MNEIAPVQEVERKMFGRTWWILPLGLAIIFPFGKACAWALIGLDAGLVGFPSARVILLYGALGLLIGFGTTGLWGLSLRVSALRFASWRASLISGLMLALLVEMVVRSPVIVDALWASVRARAQSDEDFFIREVALFRRMALTNERIPSRPRLQIVGSSQLIMGVDFDLLQSLRPDLQVERRCVAAMAPGRMLMSSSFLGTRTGDTIVVYWSEFDMGGMTSMDVDWYRAFSNWKGLRDVLALLPECAWRRSFYPTIELFWASGSELWRSRDAWRILNSRAVGSIRSVEGAGTTQPSVMAGQIAGYAAGLSDDAYFDMGLRSALKLLHRWRDAGAMVIVLEGSVNPAMHQSTTPLRRQETRLRLESKCATLGFIYVSAERQLFHPGHSDWDDGTHLNGDGRAKFTRYLAAIPE